VASVNPATGQAIGTAVLVNRITPDLLAPFGGVKESGIGREFGEYGFEAFLEPKTVALATS